jgi:K+ transporter
VGAITGPWADEDTARVLGAIAPRVWRAHAHFGFMEQPDIPALLHRIQSKDYPLDFSDVTYFVGAEASRCQKCRGTDGTEFEWSMQKTA